MSKPLSSESRKIVIIGLGTGGLYSSRAASRYDRKVEITIIEKRDYDMFSPCGLPYALEGMVESFEALKHTVPATRQLKKLLKHEALSIDTEGKKVHVKNLETDETFWVEYDSLIISSGSQPIILPIPGAKELLGKGVHVVTNPENAKELHDAVMESKTAVVVGGGAIGLEISFALKERGLDVWVTKRSPPPFPRNLDPDMGKIISEYLDSKGLHILFGKGIDAINGEDKVESVVIAGETIPTDIVVMAVGVRSESTLAEAAGIATERGSILTNEKMETNVKDVYAIGDCALSFSGVDGKPSYVALATSALKQSVIAGVNAAGGDAVFGGNLGTFVSYIGDLEVSCTGYNSSTAERNGFKVVSGRVNMQIKPNWMPDAKDISVKLVADAETGRILGGQAIGEEGAAWRMNIVALAIKQKMNIQELSTIELAYCPAVSEVYDPLLVAADVALRRFERQR
ncbi:NAD(FAD)-dependent dehydrogenase [Thaumarchaeota archaeon SCGC AB-539-E09]|nr:NAD(FAD)-dependent dehydrogenase [Thaumarchaeota archaeon SCGC AB-539-E09]